VLQIGQTLLRCPGLLGATGKQKRPLQSRLLPVTPRLRPEIRSSAWRNPAFASPLP
jgi:hypothetical protein